MVLHDGAEHPGNVAKSHGRVPDHVYENVFKGYSAVIPDAALHRVLNDSRVKYIEPDGVAYAIAKPDQGGKPGKPVVATNQSPLKSQTGESTGLADRPIM